MRKRGRGGGSSSRLCRAISCLRGSGGDLFGETSTTACASSGQEAPCRDSGWRGARLPCFVLRGELWSSLSRGRRPAGGKDSGRNRSMSIASRLLRSSAERGALRKSGRSWLGWPSGRMRPGDYRCLCALRRHYWEYSLELDVSDRRRERRSCLCCYAMALPGVGKCRDRGQHSPFCYQDQQYQLVGRTA